MADPQKQVVGRTLTQISARRHQLKRTNPNVVCLNFWFQIVLKSQMVSISLYINEMVVYLLPTCPASGWGWWGKARTNSME